MTTENSPRIDQTAMAEALGGSAMIGGNIEIGDTSIRALGSDDAEKNADIYDATHPIVPTALVEPTQATVLDILKSDGVDDLSEDSQVVPSQVISSAQRRHPAFDEMYIDGIMKRIPRN